MAAIRLARAGKAVTIFDGSHPREKPCGGGVTARALALIADAVDVAALPALAIESALVEEPAGTNLTADCAGVTIPLKPGAATRAAQPLLIVISRAIFDKALLDAAIRAGAELVPRKVVDVARSDRTMTVQTTGGSHAADFLLGADGANSLVRKKLARPFRRSELSIAAGYFVTPVRETGPPTIAIQSMLRQPGYLWSFPRPDHLAIGVCAPAASSATSTDLRLQSLEWIHAHGLHHDAGLQPYAWPIPSVGFNQPGEMCAAGPGWMLLGDAAGLVDPLTREGIYYALLSGIWAAEAISANATDRPDQLYAARLRRELYPELNRAANLSGLFFSPRFSQLLIAALRQSGQIREIFVELVAGIQPYRGLRRRLLGTREWKLAGRAMQLVVQ